VMALAVLAHEGAFPDLGRPLAVDDGRLGRDRAAPQGGDAGEDLEGRAGRIEGPDGLVAPGLAGLDVVAGRLAEAWGKTGQVVVGLAGHDEHLASFHVERHRRADAVAERLLGRLLEIDVERGGQALAMHRHPALDRLAHLVAGRIDAENTRARLALHKGIEAFLEAIAADGALHLEGGEVLAGKILRLEVIIHPDVAQGMRGGGMIGIVARAGGINLQG